MGKKVPARELCFKAPFGAPSKQQSCNLHRGPPYCTPPLTNQSPGRLAWEVEGDSGSEVRFSDGKFVSKVFPGMLTVSLLAVEGLPTIVVSETSRKKLPLSL